MNFYYIFIIQGGYMNIAYFRVSTVDQNKERQLEGLKQYNIEKWFIEKVSGNDTNRLKLKEMIDYGREDDIIFVWNF